MNKKIEKEIKKERKDIEKIEEDMSRLKEKLLEKVPARFSQSDLVNSFFASLLVGVTFVLKGAVIRTAEVLTRNRLLIIVLSTIVILCAEIYFIGYSRVKYKAKRRACQFIAKRFFTYLIISYLISTFLIYVTGLNLLLSTQAKVINLVILVSMPCAIGAAVPSLLKKY